MHERQVKESTEAIARAAPVRHSPVTEVVPSAALVLALQRFAGNGAVTRQLADHRHLGKYVTAPAQVVQRCGPVPCNCSAEERAEYEASNETLTGESAATQDIADGAPVPVQRDCQACEEGEPNVQRVLTSGLVLQRVPGDGMVPPGDCSYGTYIPLRMSVESAKAIVSMWGPARLATVVRSSP